MAPHSSRLVAMFVAPIVALLLGVTPPKSCRAQHGGHASLTDRLDKPVSATWRGQTLANAVQRLSELTGVSIWLDRRVDPRAVVDLSVHDESAKRVLQALAEQQRLGATVLRRVVYLGPQQTASELPTLTEIARQGASRLPTDARRRWMQSSALAWPRLSEPRELVRQLSSAAGAEASNLDLTPHDLWRQRELPPMPRVDALVLILAGFDLTCEFSADGSVVEIDQIARPVRLTEDYRASPAATQAAEQVLGDNPLARVQRTRDGFRLQAPWPQHVQIRRLVAGGSNSSRQSGAERRQAKSSSNGPPVRRAYTLRIAEQPLGAVLDQLARQLELNVQWPSHLDVATQRRRRISCEVSQVDQDELLRRVLSPAGLTFRRDGADIQIRQAEQGDPSQ